MKPTYLIIILWALAGIMALLFFWLFWNEYRADGARTESEPLSQAGHELTDNSKMKRMKAVIAGWQSPTFDDIVTVIKNFGGDAVKTQPLFLSIESERDPRDAPVDFVPRSVASNTGSNSAPESIAHDLKKPKPS